MKKCQYQSAGSAGIASDKQNYKSGFRECWKEQKNLSDSDFSRKFIFDIWNFSRHNKLIENDIFFIDQVSDEIFTKIENQHGINAARQLLQIRKTRENDAGIFFNKQLFNDYKRKWNYPLHFIDFETSTSAIPFFKRQKPCEITAFQYSHHVMEPDGKVRHAREFISYKPGEYPDINLIRALKAEIEKDNGTIFRYSFHENTVLNKIRKMLLKPDTVFSAGMEQREKYEIVTFIESITTRNRANGLRSMADMCELVKDCYYQFSMGGGNSIKYVLPTALDNSDYLRQRYSSPIYGCDPGCLVHSKNCQTKTWVTYKNGQALNPYKLLDPVEMEDGGFLINHGGAASAAWAKMQDSLLPEESRIRIRDALLRYCELDTLAMVMIMEHWLNDF